VRRERGVGRRVGRHGVEDEKKSRRVCEGREAKCRALNTRNKYAAAVRRTVRKGVLLRETYSRVPTEYIYSHEGDVMPRRRLARGGAGIHGLENSGQGCSPDADVPWTLCVRPTTNKDRAYNASRQDIHSPYMALYTLPESQNQPSASRGHGGIFAETRVSRRGRRAARGRPLGRSRETKHA
jgi:hypothetical protein